MEIRFSGSRCCQARVARPHEPRDRSALAFGRPACGPSSVAGGMWPRRPTRPASGPLAATPRLPARVTPLDTPGQLRGEPFNGLSQSSTCGWTRPSQHEVCTAHTGSTASPPCLRGACKRSAPRGRRWVDPIPQTAWPSVTTSPRPRLTFAHGSERGREPPATSSAEAGLRRPRRRKGRRFSRRGVRPRSVGRIAPFRGSTWVLARTQGSQGSPHSASPRAGAGLRPGRPHSGAAGSQPRTCGPRAGPPRAREDAGVEPRVTDGRRASCTPAPPPTARGTPLARLPQLRGEAVGPRSASPTPCCPARAPPIHGPRQSPLNGSPRTWPCVSSGVTRAGRRGLAAKELLLTSA